MKKSIVNYLVIAAVVVLAAFSGCKKDDDAQQGSQSNQTSSGRIYVSDISDVIEKSIMYLHPDGSYIIMIFDKTTDLPAKAYINTITKKENEGTMVIFDNLGFPNIIKSLETGLTYVCTNYNENKVDIAIIDNSGNTNFYWGLTTDKMFDLNPYVNESIQKMSKAELYTHISWGAKAIGMTIAAVSAAALIVSTSPISITVGVVSAAALIISTALSNVEEVQNTTKVIDIYNSTYSSNNHTFSIKNISIKDMAVGIVIDAVADIFEELAEDEHIKAINSGMDEYREFQIELSPWIIEMSSTPSEATVTVTTKSNWYIDNVDNGWCFATKSSENTIKIYIVEENKAGTRECKVLIVPMVENEYVKPVWLIIKQIGNDYTISPKSLSFDAKGGQQGFTISFSENSPNVTVESVNVIDGNSWCHIASKSGIKPISVQVKADKNNDNSSRNALIEVVFKMGEYKPSTTVSVTQKGTTNEANWHCTTSGLPENYDLSILIKPNGVAMTEGAAGTWTMTGNSIKIRFAGKDNISFTLNGTMNEDKNKITGTCIDVWAIYEENKFVGNETYNGYFVMDKTQGTKTIKTKSSTNTINNNKHNIFTI